jgi:hypothetical protein
LFAYDAATLSQQAVFVTTPNGGLGGVWMTGTGVAGDANGNIFIASGNGDFDTTNVPATEVGDTLMKVRLAMNSFALVDYFTPYDQSNLDSSDLDLGSGGPMLLPDQAGSNPDEVIQVGKNGTLYLVNRDQMTAGNVHYCSSGCSSDPEIVQEFPAGTSYLFGTPSYWNGSIYDWPVNNPLQAFTLNLGLFSTTPASSSAFTIGFPGSVPEVSANGTSSAIVWSIDASAYKTPGPAVLHAFNASNLSTELYNSSQAQTPPNRDQAGPAVKFTVPTVANGKVYIGTQTELDVYGILP